MTEIVKKSQKDYTKKFYEKNPDLKTKVFICDECGHEYKYFNKGKHMKTKIHRLVVEKLKQNNN